MQPRKRAILDGNEAAASVAYRLSEVIAIYPITPSSNMGEYSDEWAAAGKPNLWGTVPSVTEMQSEGGASGACHGALQAGALSTTFTASQGLLLMIPNLYKIAGELTSFCMHVSARSVATHALSIFGDHSDVMACRQTGIALLASGSVQEAHDMAAVGHAATLEARLPFLHFFDGFRTSHELQRIDLLTDEHLKELISEEAIAAHRRRALSPDRPVLRGSAQNPDVFFQAREAINPFYTAAPGLVAKVMERFGQVTGRQYRLFEYEGHAQAERVIVIMGSGAETARETARWLVARGEKVGVLTVRLYRPFSLADFMGALPKSVKTIAVLDRTKEPGAIGEPLFLDVVTGLEEARATGLVPADFRPNVIGGRYGLSSKEFTPAMIKAVYDEAGSKSPRRRFTVGITDDVTGLSLPVDDAFDIEEAEVVRAVFYGLGADGTVGANKNSIKIIGEETELNPQGYFVYDSKKSGAVTTSHLRFGPKPIKACYLIRQAGFVACHQYPFLEKLDMLQVAAPGATFLLNSPFPPDRAWDDLPREVQAAIIEKNLKLYVIDAYSVARDAGMKGRINTIMQTCFFALSGVLPRDEAIAKIKETIKKTYSRRGEDVVKKNFAMVDDTLANLHEVQVPKQVTATRGRPPVVAPEAPDFVKRVTAVILEGRGDWLPVSAFPPDGTWPTATAQWEKRNIAEEIPVWDEKLCIQCNKCALVCPHAAIRPKIYEPAALNGAPNGFQSVPYRSKENPGLLYTLQVAPEDCTGCTLCVKVCPAKDKTNPRHKALDMTAQAPLRFTERDKYQYFLGLPEFDRTVMKIDVKGSQFMQPLFEYSGACSGCGETPYVKLLTQLFGDRALIANATGCSSIYGGNLPTTPYAVNSDGRGPAWSNSLFEDNAEFGFGFRLAIDQKTLEAQRRLKELAGRLGDQLVHALMTGDQSSEAGIREQRARVAELKKKLAALGTPEALQLVELADDLVRKSVWIVGGDGWAYDIGYGGLDHVLAAGRDVNLLVLDTEVYSNTGGQASKATPLGAAARFAVAGKEIPKKDLGMMAMAYGNVYVAHVAFGAKDQQTVQTFLEAEAYPGPSLIIAYSHCIAHGYDMAMGLDQQKTAVDTGYWPLYRFDPRLPAQGRSPLIIESGEPKQTIDKFARNEARFRVIEQTNPERFKKLMNSAQRFAQNRFAIYEQMARILAPEVTGVPEGSEPVTTPAGSDDGK